MTPEEESSLRKTVLSAAKSAALMRSAINDGWWQAQSERGEVAIAALVDLQSSTGLNLLSSFDQSAVAALSKRDAIRCGSVLRCLLPKIEGSASEVMKCITAFSSRPSEQGNYYCDDGFAAWCRVKPERALEALPLAKNVPAYNRLLTVVLESGAFSDPKFFLEEAIRLSSVKDFDLARFSIIALGSMNLSSDPALAQAARNYLAAIALDADADEVTAVSLAALADRAVKDRDASLVLGVVTAKTSAAGLQTNRAFAECLWRLSKIAPNDLIAALLNALSRVEVVDGAVLSHIDLGLTDLLDEHRFTMLVAFVEQLMNREQHSIPLSALDSFTHKLTQERRDLFERLVVTWFLHGSHTCRKQAAELVAEVNGENAPFEIDLSKWGLSDAELVSLCRKAIGFFPLAPVAAASILVAALRPAAKDAAVVIGDLLFFPLLVNYPGSGQQFVKAQAASEPKGPVRKQLDRALKNLKKYLSDLHAADELSELRPSPHERQVQRERDADEAQATMKAARERSVLLSVVSTSVLLHGSSSVSYLRAPDGQMHRSEVPLGSFSTSMELPRLDILDPLGFDYLLTVFRSEPCHK